VLFSTSIAENIAYARPGASPDEVVTAAKAASAHDFICALPDGYDTAVGERGVRLSGGERQRISLARAFLKDAPILILDEPTSSVDARTEAEILGAMERLMRGRTALMIAHRTSTLDICDVRLELEHGRVASTTAAGARGARRARRGMVAAATPRTAAPARRARGPVPVSCDPVNHPVAEAWRAVASTRSRIDRVERLKAKEQRQVYRLTIGDGATSVIAKRARRETTLLERTLYETILPQLPSSTLRYFGFVSDPDEQFAWLFLEDAGDDPCSLADYGPLAAEWLGTLHGAAAEFDLPASLPEHTPGRYLEHLRAARTTIMDNLDNPALDADDRRALHALVSTCELIESSWSGIEDVCTGLRRTLVHGDLAAKNLRIRQDEGGPAIVAFDWEWSGFGIPATDVFQFGAGATRTDLDRYRSTISAYSRRVDDDELQALVSVGKGFRLLASLDWATTHLPYARPEEGMAALRFFEQPVREWGDTLAAAA
jgi:energy-coupling factor transporter ATP-binding protein EcfA2